MPKTIDITPTWASLMPAMIAVLENGGEEGKQAIREELLRAAAIIDSVNNRSLKDTLNAAASLLDDAAEETGRDEYRDVSTALLMLPTSPEGGPVSA